MSAHLSDRRRIERLVIVALFESVLRLGARDLAEPETAETAARLQAVRADLFEGTALARHENLKGRLSRAIRVFDRFMTPGTPVAEFGLLAFHFAKILIDRDVLTIGAESDLSKALDRLLPALEEAEVRPGAHILAEESAWRAMRLLQKTGYFPEIGHE